LRLRRIFSRQDRVSFRDAGAYAIIASCYGDRLDDGCQADDSWKGGVAMISKLLLIFLAGFIVDVLVTKHTRYVADKKTGRATLLSGMITIVNFTLLTIILDESSHSNLINIMAFAGGNTLGTFLAMRRA
jgi:hypothetical protein